MIIVPDEIPHQMWRTVDHVYDPDGNLLCVLNRQIVWQAQDRKSGYIKQHIEVENKEFPQSLPKDLFESNFTLTHDYRYTTFSNDEMLGGGATTGQLFIARGMFPKQAMRFRVKVALWESGLQYSITEMFYFSNHVATAVSIMTADQHSFPKFEGSIWPGDAATAWKGEGYVYDPSLAVISSVKRSYESHGWKDQVSGRGAGSFKEITLYNRGDFLKIETQSRFSETDPIYASDSSIARRFGWLLEIQAMSVIESGYDYQRRFILFDFVRQNLLEILTGWAEGPGDGPDWDYSGPEFIIVEFLKPISSAS